MDLASRNVTRTLYVGFRVAGGVVGKRIARVLLLSLQERHKLRMLNSGSFYIRHSYCLQSKVVFLDPPPTLY